MMCIYFADVNTAKNLSLVGHDYIFPMQLETQVIWHISVLLLLVSIKNAVTARPQLILLECRARHERHKTERHKNPLR